MNLDPTVIAKGVAMQKRDHPIEDLLDHATCHHQSTFERLHHWKAYADAIWARTHDQTADDLPPCHCGRFFATRRGRSRHMAECDEAPDMDPRMPEVLARYEEGEHVRDIVDDVGISTKTLYSWVKRNGVRRRGQSGSRRSA